MSTWHVSMADRLRQSGRLLRSEGLVGVTDRIRERAAQAIRPKRPKRLEVSRKDFLRASQVAAGGSPLPGPMKWEVGEPLTIGWICTPPAPGSGGHTTMFRMVSALEGAGHRCVVYLIDQHGWSLDQHKKAIHSWWPNVRAEIRNCADGIQDTHALFATGWGSAYTALGSDALGIRCYFVQDFEPAFGPAGSESLLAEATYRFGFEGVTMGRWLAPLLSRRYGMHATSIDFGCDVETYRLDPAAATRTRTGICYYCRPSTPRRAHELAILALEQFADAHPLTEIHLYGEDPGRLPFAVTHHGLLPPRELGALYRRCTAGLTLSATNVSLVPLEMLAAGCIPVVNDAEHNRIVLDNPYVSYSPATPHDLAAALTFLVTMSSRKRQELAIQAAESVVSRSWGAVGEEFVRIVEKVVADQGAVS